jgi:indole-3-glycerol phosphate synthase
MPAMLDQIVASTRARVAESKRNADLVTLQSEADRHIPRGFRQSLERVFAETGVAVIAELKQASPSKGVIRANLHVTSLAQELHSAGAAALSVLTEPQFFQGSLSNLRKASSATPLPCLRKDFIVDEFQLLEARAHGADAVLLIASVLPDEQLRDLHDKARGLGLDVLCEVHDSAELPRVLQAGCAIIGVNSRDLRNFNVDLQTPIELAKAMPAGTLPVAESGIRSPEDITRLRDAGYRAFLIGESLMKAENPGEALKTLLSGAQQKATVIK